MYSLRKWLYKPKKTDTSLLAQFYHSDEELYLVASELDSFDGRRDPERCAMLVNELRFWQDSVLSTIEKVMDDAIPLHRTSRDFRVKFPDDVLHESLAGQLWFGAECLAAGSIIMNREVESASMRPLARALTKNLDSLRTILRDQCLRNINSYTEKAKEALVIFDKLLAEFELSYVSSMVPVKTMKEYDLMQEVIVLFSETLARALRMKLLTQDLVDDYDPAVMFTIPRLAIVCGLLIYPEGPLNPDNSPHNMSEMFRPFQSLLQKIRELLHTLTSQELYQLEKLLCSQDQGVSLTDDYLSFSDYSNQQHLADKSVPLLAHQSTHIPAPNSLLCDPTRIITHSPDSGGSPVTPMNDDLDVVNPVDSTAFLPSSVSKSSIATIVAKPSSNSDPDSDEMSIDDADVNYVFLRSDIAAIADVICPSGEGRGQPECVTLHGDSDSGLHSDSCSLVEVASTNVPRRSDSACGVSVTSGDGVECGESGHDAADCDHIEAFHESRDSIELPGSVNAAAVDECTGWVAARNSASSEHDCLSSTSQSCAADYPQQRTLSCGVNTQECSMPCDHSVAVDAILNRGDDITCAERVINCETTESNGGDERCTNPSHSHVYSELAEIAVTSMIGRDTPASTNDLSVLSSLSVNPDTSDSDIQHSTRDGTRLKFPTGHLTDDGPVRKQRDHYCDSRRNCVSPATQTRRSTRCPKHKNENTHGALPNPVIPSSSDIKPKMKDSQEDICTRCCGCVVTGADVKVDDIDTHSICSSDTSSYNSDSHDDEEIALAIHAAEVASRNEVRSRFQNSSDLIHRLFVCISGVADQLQTNYASDLRNILKCVFDLNCSDSPSPSNDDKTTAVTIAMNNSMRPATIQNIRPNSSPRDTPTWLPDLASSTCMGCHAPFTLTRRRHHCRNCGKLFCSRCSSNSVPLPHFGHVKPVRVCIRCFIYHVTPFTVAST